MKSNKKYTLPCIIAGIICLAALASFIIIKATNISPKLGKTNTRNEKEIMETEETVNIEDIFTENEVLVSDKVISISSSANQSEETEPTDIENSDYIIPESNSRYLEEHDLEALTPENLAIARNEIYARHGRMFLDETIQSYFVSKEWYEPQYEPDEFDAMNNELLNEYEIANAQFISDYETENEYR